MVTSSRATPHRYGLIASLVIACLLVLAALAVALGLKLKTEPSSASSHAAATSSSSNPAWAASRDNDRVCDHEEDTWATGPLIEGPDVEWEQRGDLRFPTSSDFGPAAVDEEGFHYCFQHSPEGAVLAATTNAIHGFDYTNSLPWFDYFTSEGEYRDTYVTNEPGSTAEESDHETWLLGFEVHEYDESTAEVEIFILADFSEFPMAVQQKLVWADGDWKIDASQPDAMGTDYAEDIDDMIMWGNEESFT